MATDPIEWIREKDEYLVTLGEDKTSIALGNVLRNNTKGAESCTGFDDEACNDQYAITVIAGAVLDDTRETLATPAAALTIAGVAIKKTHPTGIVDVRSNDKLLQKNGHVFSTLDQCTGYLVSAEGIYWRKKLWDLFEEERDDAEWMDNERTRDADFTGKLLSVDSRSSIQDPGISTYTSGGVSYDPDDETSLPLFSELTYEKATFGITQKDCNCNPELKPFDSTDGDGYAANRLFLPFSSSYWCKPTVFSLLDGAHDTSTGDLALSVVYPALEYGEDSLAKEDASGKNSVLVTFENGDKKLILPGRTAVLEVDEEGEDGEAWMPIDCNYIKSYLASYGFVIPHTEADKLGTRGLHYKEFKPVIPGYKDTVNEEDTDEYKLMSEPTFKGGLFFNYWEYFSPEGWRTLVNKWVDSTLTAPQWIRIFPDGCDDATLVGRTVITGLPPQNTGTGEYGRADGGVGISEGDDEWVVTNFSNGIDGEAGAWGRYFPGYSMAIDLDHEWDVNNGLFFRLMNNEEEGGEFSLISSEAEPEKNVDTSSIPMSQLPGTSMLLGFEGKVSEIKTLYYPLTTKPYKKVKADTTTGYYKSSYYDANMFVETEDALAVAPAAGGGAPGIDYMNTVTYKANYGFVSDVFDTSDITIQGVAVSELINPHWTVYGCSNTENLNDLPESEMDEQYLLRFLRYKIFVDVGIDIFKIHGHDSENERKINVKYYSTSVVSSVDPSGGSEEGVRSGGLYDGYQYKLPEGYWDENNVSAYLLLDWATAKAMCDYHLLNWDTMISYVVEEAAQLGEEGGDINTFWSDFGVPDSMEHVEHFENLKKELIKYTLQIKYMLRYSLTPIQDIVTGTAAKFDSYLRLQSEGYEHIENPICDFADLLWTKYISNGELVWHSIPASTPNEIEYTLTPDFYAKSYKSYLMGTLGNFVFKNTKSDDCNSYSDYRILSTSISYHSGETYRRDGADAGGLQILLNSKYTSDLSEFYLAYTGDNHSTLASDIDEGNSNGYYMFSGDELQLGRLDMVIAHVGTNTVTRNNSTLHMEGNIKCTAKLIADEQIVVGSQAREEENGTEIAMKVYGLAVFSKAKVTDVPKLKCAAARCGIVEVSSDIRLKKDIKTVPNALEKVTQMRGCEWAWKKNDTITTGVIAQEIITVDQNLVSTHDDFYSVNYFALSGYFIEAIKEQNLMIIKQGNEIEKLKSMIGKILEKFPAGQETLW